MKQFKVYTTAGIVTMPANNEVEAREKTIEFLAAESIGDRILDIEPIVK